MGHMFFAPSSAHIWGKPDGCRAAPTVAVMFPERQDSPAALEGTAAHELAALHLERQLRALQPPNLVDQTASNGVVYDAEMVEAANVYAVDVRREAINRGIFGGGAITLEKNLLSPRIHELNGGTPDFTMHDARSRTIIVWDFKYGHGIVEAYENWQLMNYAALLLDHYEIDGLMEQEYTFILKVVQPRGFKRSGPVDSWTVKATDLRPYWNDMATGAREALEPDALARVGAHCKHCPGRHACETLRYAASAAMDYASSATTDNLPGQAVALELGWLERAGELISYRLSGLKEETEARLRAGEVVPGYGLENDFGKTTWKDPQQALGFGAAYGLDLRKNEPITPAQAKKAGLPDEVVKNFSYKPPRGHKLARIKDNQAKKVFTQ